MNRPATLGGPVNIGRVGRVLTPTGLRSGGHVPHRGRPHPAYRKEAPTLMLAILQEPTGGAFSLGEVWGGIVAFLVLSGGLFAAWRALSKQIEDFRDKDLKELGSRTERVETRLGERITRVETRLTDALREFMRDVKTILVKAPSSVDSNQSPITLTPLGEAISKQLGASDWADRTAALVSGDVEGKEPYEIQEFLLPLRCHTRASG